MNWAPYTVLDAAIDHARRGLPVFPVNFEKEPLVRHGYKDASADLLQVRRWWSRWPVALIGIPTGAATGLLVVDIDMKDGTDGERSWNALMVRLGVYEPRTRIVTTPSGGRHLYFRYPEIGEPIRNSAGRLGPGLDIRGDGGSIIAHGSRRAGKPYELIHDIEPAPVPEWLATALRLLKDLPPPPKPVRVPIRGSDHAEAWALAALADECRIVAQAPKGQRNDQLNRSAYAIGQIVGGGYLHESEACTHLWQAAKACGLSDLEATGTIHSGMKAGKASPRQPDEVQA